MTITNERFRRAEAMLHAAGINVDYAITLISLVLESVENGCIGNISLKALCDRAGCDVTAAHGWITREDAILAERLGFRFIDNVEHFEVEDARLEASSQLLSVVTGKTILSFDEEQPRIIAPDTQTIAWCALVCSAADAGGGSAFLYRSGEDDGEPRAEFERLLGVLAAQHRAPEDVFLYTEGGDRDVSSSAGAVLSAVLHSDRAILVIGLDVLAPLAQQTVYDDYSDHDEYDGAFPRVHGWRRFTSAGERLIGLLPYAPITTLVVIPEDTVLRPRDAAHFVSAVGPYRIDREMGLNAIKASAANALSNANAERLLTLWQKDPSRSRVILDGADRIVTRADHHGSARRESDHTATSESDEAYNAVVHAMVTGLSHHVWASSKIKAKLAPPAFFRELFICDPDPQILFENQLRDGTYNILLGGEPGSGKSAASSHLAKLMGMESLDIKASDLLGHKWGFTERAVSKCFREARRLGRILVFDEADSLVQSRSFSNSNNMHLVTALTNQFLVELDCHDLPTIFCTNFADRIDPAIRRRMDLSFQVLPVPEQLEHRAFELMLGITDVPPSVSFGGTSMIADYAAAKKLIKLTGDRSLQAAIKAVRHARDVRVGQGRTRHRIGF